MNSKIKKLIKQMKCHFELDIKKAKANGFEAVMVPLNIDFEVYHISVNDDEDEILDILNRFLSRKHDVTLFNNPVKALSSIKSGANYDVIVTDIMMPEIDGLGLLKEVMAFDPRAKVIMMTAFDSMDKALDAHKLGAKNYIKKPFKSLDDVNEKIMAELQ